MTDRAGRTVRLPSRSRGGRSVTTTVAALLVLVVAVLRPGPVLSVPIEGIVLAAVAVALPPRAGRVAGWWYGAGLGVVAVEKVVDGVFLAALGRPFDPLDDLGLVVDGARFVDAAYGRAGLIIAIAGAAAVVVAVVTVMVRSVQCLLALAERHRRRVTRAGLLAACGGVVLGLLTIQAVTGTSVARSEAVVGADRLSRWRADQRADQAFVAGLERDAYRTVPPAQLLTGLQGKDVVVAFVESYGRSAVEDPRLDGPVDAVLRGGDQTLAGVGFAARSGYLTSATVGGGSWLAHATLLSGVWVDDQQRYRQLMASNRLTLNRAFQEAGWRTVGIVPGITQPWSEGAFFGYDQVYDGPSLGYQGPRFSWAPMPDQYIWSRLETVRRAADQPVMAELHLVSSHAPWSPVPTMISWDEVGDGSAFASMAADGAPPEAILTRSPDRVRSDYQRSIAYSLEALVSYVQTYGDDDLVLVVVGDHQPSPVVTGPDAGRDVPISIITRDQTILDRVSSWQWSAGLRPARDAPVWSMETFRDRFLSAYGPTG